MRALAVSTSEGLDVLPDVPAMDESLPGYEASGWYGIAAPKETPPEIIERLNKEINAGLTDTRQRCASPTLGAWCFRVAGRHGKYVAAEIEKWGKVIRTAGIKAE